MRPAWVQGSVCRTSFIVINAQTDTRTPKASALLRRTAQTRPGVQFAHSASPARPQSGRVSVLRTVTGAVVPARSGHGCAERRKPDRQRSLCIPRPWRGLRTQTARPRPWRERQTCRNKCINCHALRRSAQCTQNCTWDGCPLRGRSKSQHTRQRRACQPAEINAQTVTRTPKASALLRRTAQTRPGVQFAHSASPARFAQQIATRAPEASVSSGQNKCANCQRSP